MVQPESEPKDAATIATGEGVFSVATVGVCRNLHFCSPVGSVAVLAWPITAGERAVCAAAGSANRCRGS